MVLPDGDNVSELARHINLGTYLGWTPFALWHRDKHPHDVIHGNGFCPQVAGQMGPFSTSLISQLLDGQQAPYLPSCLLPLFYEDTGRQGFAYPLSCLNLNHCFCSYSGI